MPTSEPLEPESLDGTMSQGSMPRPGASAVVVARPVTPKTPNTPGTPKTANRSSLKRLFSSTARVEDDAEQERIRDNEVIRKVATMFDQRRLRKEQMKAERARQRAQSRHNLLLHVFSGETWVLLPMSTERLALDWLVVMGALFTGVFVPLRVGFRQDLATGYEIGEWITFAVFMLDIYINFHVTFLNADGEYHRSGPLIASEYLRRHFVLDFLANLPWLAVPTEGRLELLQILPLLRMLRLQRIFGKVTRAMTKVNSSLIRVMNMAFWILVVAHFLACAFVYTSAVRDFPIESWVYQFGLQDATRESLYTNALYWTFTVMTTVGFGDITPINDTEKLFAVVAMVIGVGMYAVIFGNLSALLVSWDASAQRYQQKIAVVSEYIRYRNLPDVLGRRILQYYDVIWSRHKGLDEAAILQDLPASLHSEVALYLHRELVQKVPIFKDCTEAGFINSLVVKLKSQVSLPGDSVVRHGDIGRTMFFIKHGKVDVVSAEGNHLITLGDGDYFGEVALLFEARRIATVRANTYCDLLSLSKEDFDDTLEYFPDYSAMMRKIARAKLDEERRKRLEAQKARGSSLNSHTSSAGRLGRTRSGPGINKSVSFRHGPPDIQEEREELGLTSEIEHMQKTRHTIPIARHPSGKSLDGDKDEPRPDPSPERKAKKPLSVEVLPEEDKGPAIAVTAATPNPSMSMTSTPLVARPGEDPAVLNMYGASTSSVISASGSGSAAGSASAEARRAEVEAGRAERQNQMLQGTWRRSTLALREQQQQQDSPDLDDWLYEMSDADKYDAPQRIQSVISMPLYTESMAGTMQSIELAEEERGPAVAGPDGAGAGEDEAAGGGGGLKALPRKMRSSMRKFVMGVFKGSKGNYEVRDAELTAVPAEEEPSQARQSPSDEGKLKRQESAAVSVVSHLEDEDKVMEPPRSAR